MDAISRCRAVGEPKPHQDLQIVDSPRCRNYSNVVSAIFLFSARVITAVVQLRIVEQYWGGSYSGLNVLCNQILLYVALLELGLAQSATSLLYEPIAKEDLAQASAIVIAVRNDVRRLSTVGAIVLVPLLYAYAAFVHSSIPFWTIVYTFWLIASAGLIQLASIHFQVYLNAAEQIDRINYVLGAGFLVKTTVGLAVATHWHQYLLLPATIAMLSIGEFAGLRAVFRISFRDFRSAPSKHAEHLVRRRAKFVLVHKVAGLAFYQSDFIILSLTASLSVVTNYAKYQYVSAALLSMVGMIATALTTSIARHQIRETPDARRRQYALAQFVTSLIGTSIMLGYSFSAHTAVALAFGAGVAIGSSSLWLFGIALCLNVVKMLDDVFITAKGAFDVGCWIPAIEVPIYIATGVLLSKHIGFPGILVACIATNLSVSVMVKGTVLARPVFEMTRTQWFYGRTRSIGKAVLLLSPVALIYLVFLNRIQSDVVRSVMVDTLLILYSSVVLHSVLEFDARKGRAAC